MPPAGPACPITDFALSFTIGLDLNTLDGGTVRPRVPMTALRVLMAGMQYFEVLGCAAWLDWLLLLQEEHGDTAGRKIGMGIAGRLDKPLVELLIAAMAQTMTVLAPRHHSTIAST